MEEFVTAFDARYSLPQASMLARVTGDVQLVSIATPQNPSGIVIPGPALAGLVDGIALRAPDAIVLVDETFREASESPEPSAIALGDRVVVLGSLSKAYGTAGLRLGWIASQSRRWIEQLERAKAELFHSVSVVDEAMAVEVLDRSEDVLKAQRAEIATGLRLVENWVSANGNMVEWLRPDAGAMCVIRPRLAGSQEAKLFEQALIRNGIALASGELFGDSRGIYRLGFGGKPAGVLEGGLEALGECLAAVR
jgi:aspartate/methionine/tyrosine aminotransferase